MALSLSAQLAPLSDLEQLPRNQFVSVGEVCPSLWASLGLFRAGGTHDTLIEILYGRSRLSTKLLSQCFHTMLILAQSLASFSLTYVIFHQSIMRVFYPVIHCKHILPVYSTLVKLFLFPGKMGEM